MTASKGRQDLTDAKGFLADPHQWDAEVAAALAAHLGIPSLGAAHWRVVRHLRELYLCRGDSTLQQQICREFELDPDCIVSLFGGFIEAWTVAGLPDPGEELVWYMAQMEVYDWITSGSSAVARGMGWPAPLSRCRPAR